MVDGTAALSHLEFLAPIFGFDYARDEPAAARGAAEVNAFGAAVRPLSRVLETYRALIVRHAYDPR